MASLDSNGDVLTGKRSILPADLCAADAKGAQCRAEIVGSYSSVSFTFSVVKNSITSPGFTSL